MIGPYETSAANVHTGLEVAFAEDGYRARIEIDVQHRSTEIVGGLRQPVIRFTGFTPQLGTVERGWPHHPDDPVLVVADRRPHSHLALTGSLHESETHRVPQPDRHAEGRCDQPRPEDRP